MIYSVFSQGTEQNPTKYPRTDEPWVWRGNVGTDNIDDAVPTLLHRNVARDSDIGIWYEVLPYDRTPEYWVDSEGIEHGKPFKRPW